MDSPSPPPAPEAPDYGAANAEGVFSASALLPTQRRIEQLSKLGGKETLMIPIISNGHITGYQELPVDFTGVGDAALQAETQKQQLELAKSAAPELLALQEQYGTQYVDQLRKQQEAADPEAFALRQQLGTQLQDELALGGQLSDTQSYNIEQAVRQGQQARGQLFNPTAGIEESFAKFDVGERLKQARQQNAQAFAFGQPLAGYNVSAAQQGAAPYSPIGAGTVGTQANPNAGLLGANFAQQSYGQQSQNWALQAQMANQPNPFMGLGLGLLGTAATAGIGFGFGGPLGAAAGLGGGRYF